MSELIIQIYSKHILWFEHMLPYFQHWSNQAHPAQFQRLYAYRHRVWTKVLPSQHGAFVGVQSSSGALKHLALKCKSEMFNCVLPINSHTQHGSSVHYWCQRPWEHINRFLAVSRFRGTYQRFWAFVETYPLIKMMIRIMIEINLLKRRNMIPILNSQHITGN